MISVCIIAKNEEKNIERCLSSLRDKMCEIVIVDTGSIDRTVEIAKKYTDKIFYFSWIDDFSAAKNYCISKASNDRILFMDCDEYLDEMTLISMEEMDTILEKQEDGIGRVIIRNFYTKDAVRQESRERVGRLFDRRRYHYEGAVHEQLVSIDGENRFFNCEMYLGHTGYDLSLEEKKAKAERNIAILEKELNQLVLKEKEAMGEQARGEISSKNSLVPYYYYQMGKSYYTVHEYARAETYFENALEYDVDTGLYYVKDLIETYGYVLIEQNKYEQALSLESVYDEFSDTADFLFLMGLIYMNNAEFDLAIDNFEKAVRMPECKVVGTNSYKAFYNIGVIYECLGKTKEALSYYEKCGNYENALKRIDELAVNE